MTAGKARNQLAAFIGSELGTGDWLMLTTDRISGFERAIGQPVEEVPALLLLSLLPALTSSITLPIEAPRTLVNYGLDRCRLTHRARTGERIRARATLLEVEDGNGWLQLKRRVVVENEAGEALLSAETLTRLIW